MRKTIIVLISVFSVLAGLFFFLQPEKEDDSDALNVIFGGVGQEFIAAQKQVNIWSKKNHHSVKISQAVRGTDNRLQQYLPHFKTPAIDVYQVDVSWGPMLVDVMEDLTPYFSQEEISTIHPGVLQAGTVQGKLLFVPLYVQWLRLYVRKDLLDKYQRPIPSTWEELTETARFITEKENAIRQQSNPLWGIIFMGQPYEGMTCIALSIMASMEQGSNIFTKAGVLECYNKGNEQAWSMLHEWVNGTACHKPLTPKSVLSHQQEAIRHMFQRGDAVFMINWPYAEALLCEDNFIKEKFVVVEIPHGKGGVSTPCLGGGAIAVSRFSHNKKMAIKFLKDMISFENQKMRAKDFGYISARKDVLKEMGNIETVWENAIARPAARFKKWSAAGFTLGAKVHQYLQEKTRSPKKFLEELQSSFSDMLI